jgi:acyl-CoA reductase-like NAD-dependent aldehyde dehydrogenase
MTTSDYLYRREKIQSLAFSLTQEPFRSEFIDAYVNDTAFARKAVEGREIVVPKKLLLLQREEESILTERTPLGTVVVLVPKNSIGLTIAKAIASSYLMGNTTRIYFPSSLKNTAPIYGKLLTETLDNIEIIEGGISSAAFMRQSLKDPEVKAIVIYGDDSWIDVYKPLAEETKTKIIFEGPGNDPMIVFRM